MNIFLRHSLHTCTHTHIFSSSGFLFHALTLTLPVWMASSLVSNSFIFIAQNHTHRHVSQSKKKGKNCPSGKKPRADTDSRGRPSASTRNKPWGCFVWSELVAKTTLTHGKWMNWMKWICSKCTAEMGVVSIPVVYLIMHLLGAFGTKAQRWKSAHLFELSLQTHITEQSTQKEHGLDFFDVVTKSKGTPVNMWALVHKYPVPLETQF